MSIGISHGTGMKRTHVLAPHYQFVLIKYVNSFRVLRFSPEKNCLRTHYHIKRECLMSFGRRVAPHDYFWGLFQLIAKNTDVPGPKSVGVPVKYGPQLIHRRNSKKSPWIPNCGSLWMDVKILAVIIPLAFPAFLVAANWQSSGEQKW